MLLGFDDGVVQLRHRYDWNTVLSIANHDRDYGKVRSVLLNSEKSMLLSTSDDGTLMTRQIDFNAVIRIAKGEVVRVSL